MGEPRSPVHRRPVPFVQPLELAGWSRRSSWGYDAALECFWAELWRGDSDPAPAVRIGAEHLIITVTGLADAMATSGSVPGTDAYLALTA